MISYYVGPETSIEQMARDMVVIAHAIGDHVEAFYDNIPLRLLARADDPRGMAERIQLIIIWCYEWYLNSMYGKAACPANSGSCSAKGK